MLVPDTPHILFRTSDPSCNKNNSDSGGCVGVIIDTVHEETSPAPMNNGALDDEAALGESFAAGRDVERGSKQV